jgi:hypothetical protein
VSDRFAVTNDASHGEVTKEFRESSCVIHVDMGEEDEINPVDAHGGERGDEFWR